MSDKPHTLLVDHQPPLEADDAELIALTRAGDTAAFEVLYSRHRRAATARARRFASREADVDDLVAEAFANILEAIRKGAGPTEFFRGYLMRTVRHCALRAARHQRRTVLTDMWDSYDLAEPGRDPVTEAFDSQAVSRAFKSLPERWQTVLWHTEVEGEAPSRIAPLLGLRPNSVAALAYRAREGLRTAYHQAHITTTSEKTCRKYAAKLGAYARGKLGKTEASLMREHLENCERCRGLCLEASDVSSVISAAVALPALVPALAARLLHTSGAAEHGVGQVRVHRGPPGGNGGTLVAVGAAIAVLSVGVLSMVLPGAHRSSRDHADSASFKQPSL